MIRYGRRVGHTLLVTFLVRINRHDASSDFRVEYLEKKKKCWTNWKPLFSCICLHLVRNLAPNESNSFIAIRLNWTRRFSSSIFPTSFKRLFFDYKLYILMRLHGVPCKCSVNNVAFVDRDYCLSSKNCKWKLAAYFWLFLSIMFCRGGALSTVILSFHETFPNISMFIKTNTWPTIGTFMFIICIQCNWFTNNKQNNLKIQILKNDFWRYFWIPIALNGC